MTPRAIAPATDQPQADGLGRAATTRVRRALAPLTGSGSVAFLAALAMANVGNFAFHAVVSRRLGPASYGALGSLLSVLLAVSLPTAALQVAVTRAAALRLARGEAFSAGHVARQVGVTVTAVALALGTAAPLIAGFLHLPSARPVWWLAVYLVPAFVGMVARAALLAELRFAAVAAAVLFATVVRLALAGVVVHGGNGIEMAMAVSAASELLMAAGLTIAARRHFRSSSEPLRVDWREGASSAVAFTGVWALLSVDVILARRYLDPATAGTYAATATLSRAALFLPQAIAVIAHARASAVSKEAAARVLRAATLATLAVGVAVVGGLSVLGETLVGVLFGSAFRPSAGLLAGLSAVAGVIAVVNLFVHHRLARGQRAMVGGWLGLVVAAGISIAWHPGPVALAVASAAGALVAVVAVLPGDIGRRRAARGPAPVVDPGTDELWRPASLDLSVVIPFFNPGPVVVRQVEATVAALRPTGLTFEVIAVDDGSTDGSGELLETVVDPAVRRLRLSRNRGKGEALRRGFRSARGSRVAFIDGDGDIDPAHLPGFVALAELYGADIVVGSKRHPESDVVYPALRRLFSWGFQQLVRLTLHVPVRDTQVGVKLFDRATLAAVLPRANQQGFVLDLELLALAARVGRRRMVEAPVRIAARFTSTVSLGAVVAMLGQTLALRDAMADVPPGAQAPSPSPAPTAALQSEGPASAVAAPALTIEAR